MCFNLAIFTFIQLPDWPLPNKSQDWVIIIVTSRPLPQISYATTAERLLSLFHDSSSCIIMHDNNHQEFCAVTILSESLSIAPKGMSETQIWYQFQMLFLVPNSIFIIKSNNYYDHRLICNPASRWSQVSSLRMEPANDQILLW